VDYSQSNRNKVRRITDRGHYDKATVYDILDSSFLCHVGFVVDEQPFVIPTLYGREDDTVYLHGSAASRMMKNLAAGIPVCLTVTLVDGLVLARSAFHHSMNYRSVVVFGTAVELTGEEKERGLFVISEQVLKGRWDEVRPPVEKELKATTVLRLTIESASAKIRTGPPSDEEEDYALPIWAGVLPMRQTFDTAQNDPKLKDGIDLPPSVVNLM
jgi:nitroimidazol reductase NimA-like FMN-containing flavoprotein (pyridoxamine 5'-phosphate oxidase superfamily)